jgi:pteridine reductase
MMSSLNRAFSPVALVTGGASALGGAISRGLAQKNYRVVLHYGTSVQKTKELEAELKGAGVKTLLVQADLRKPTAARAIVKKIIGVFGRLDLLVNNASLFKPTFDSGRVVLKGWPEIFNINLFSPYVLCREAYPWLKKVKGSVVNVTDIYGEHPVLKNHAAYCLSKGGLITLTKFLAAQWGPDVRVNAVSPGVISFPRNYTAQKKKKLSEKSLLKRGGVPNDIANTVLFLTQNNFVTGQILHVDGGRFI